MRISQPKQVPFSWGSPDAAPSPRVRFSFRHSRNTNVRLLPPSFNRHLLQVRPHPSTVLPGHTRYNCCETGAPQGCLGVDSHSWCMFTPDINAWKHVAGVFVQWDGIQDVLSAAGGPLCDRLRKRCDLWQGGEPSNVVPLAYNCVFVWYSAFEAAWSSCVPVYWGRRCSGP